MKPKAEKSLARFAEAQAAARLATFQECLRHATRNPEKAKPIHDLRVSIRRFTRALRVFRLLWDRAHYRKMRRRLRELMDACAAVRNCDVAIDILEEAAKISEGNVEGPAGRIRLLYLHAARRSAYLRDRYVPKRRRAAEDRLSELLRHWKSQEIDKSWESWLEPDDTHDQDVAIFVKQILRPLLDEYLDAGDHAAGTAGFDEMHRFRLLAKQFRYTLEIFGALAGREWEAGIEEVRVIQDLLGAINDCATTGALIAGTGRDDSNIQLSLMTNWRINSFRRHWESQKKSKTWWLRWLCRPQRARRTIPRRKT